MRVIVGITGGIAAYKAPQLVRLLKKQGHDVTCVATRHALEFVTPLTLETVSGHRLYSELFDPANERNTEHIALKDWGDMMVVAPATANCIGKLATGIADDALSTLLLAFSHKPLFLAPAMNTDMWEHPAVQQNLATLQARGVNIIPPAEGELACGATGPGRMAEPEEIALAIMNEKLGIRNSADTSNNFSFLIPNSSLLKVLVTAGPTYERIDSVRFIGNYSSGKMGFALAEALAEKGYAVELVTGPTALTIRNEELGIRNSINVTRVESAREMYDAATSLFPSCHAAILSAAVADYRPDHTADHKLKKQGDEGMTLHLVQNPDILATLGGMKRDDQRLIGFALETDDEESNARRKLEKKNLDFIVLNSLRDKGAGFGVDTNRVTILGRDGSRHETPLLSKKEIARVIVEKVI